MISWQTLFIVFTVCVAIVSMIVICRGIYKVISEIDHWKHSAYKRFLIAFGVTVSPWIATLCFIAILWLTR